MLAVQDRPLADFIQVMSETLPFPSDSKKNNVCLATILSSSSAAPEEGTNANCAKGSPGSIRHHVPHGFESGQG